MKKWKWALTIIICFTPLLGQSLKITKVNPSNNEITIKNFGSTTIDITSYRLCALFSYSGISGLTIVSGDLNLEGQSQVIISGFALTTAGSDLGLYLPGSFGFDNKDNMVDFVQWGTAGNGREGVAVSKNIWAAGEFVSNIEQLEYIGDGNTHGKNLWSVGTNIWKQGLFKKLSLQATVINNGLNVNIHGLNDILINGKIFLKISDVKGKTIALKQVNSSETTVFFSDIKLKGIYSMALIADKGHAFNSLALSFFSVN